ncbi:MAG: hypothetical protein ACFFAH_10425 [Promethearchaeota archaeon]
MKARLTVKFKILFIVGLLCLVISMFLDWYYIHVYSSGGSLIAIWSYNPFTEWTMIFSGGSGYDTLSHPEDLSIPFAINIIFIPVIMICGYTVLFKDIERQRNLEKLYTYAYVNFFLLVLNTYYIFAFPVFYLLPHRYYFPYMLTKDSETNFTYYYCIGPGYLLQLIAFMIIFPYTLFYYHTLEKFKTKVFSPKNVIHTYIETVQAPLDLDELIAKEELALKYQRSPSQEKEVRVMKRHTRRARS